MAGKTKDQAPQKPAAMAEWVDVPKDDEQNEKALDVKALLALAAELKIERVGTIAGVEGVAYVREWTAKERDLYETTVFQARLAGAPVPVRGLVAAMSVCDRDGKRLFTIEQGEELGALPERCLAEIFDKASELNHLNVGIEELLRNFGFGRADASPSS